MTETMRITQFKGENCNLCGECLHRCPVLRLPIDEAKAEMKRLINGEASKYALYKCNTCFSCNLYCPTGANPYQLILERWNDLYAKRGAPPLYRFVCPTETPNIWETLNLFLSDRERQWVEAWVSHTPRPEEDLLMIGNYTHLFPFVIGGSALLDHFTPVSRVDQWEGGAYLYQGGYLEEVQRIAQRCRSDFESWGSTNVAHTLDAVEYIFSEVHPKEMGVSHSPHFINFNRWMLEKIEAGQIPLKQKLDITVTLHDNCYSKACGGAYWDVPRRLIDACGCKLIEMEHIREDSLCCGFGAGASWVKNYAMPFDIISEGAKKFREAEATGAQALVTYCGGCLYLLWATRELMGSRIDIYHIIEVVRMAMGERLDYPHAHERRAWDIIAIITYQLMRSVFQKNFTITEITYDKEMSTFRPKRYPLLRFIRFCFRSSPIRKGYAALFRTLMPFVRTR